MSLKDTFDIDQPGLLGVVRDEPSYRLPPEAWSRGENVRVVDSALEKLPGWSQVMGAPGVAPRFLMNVLSASESWWIYASLTKLYAYNGVVHTDITRASGGDYTAGSPADWNGTILGGIPIINSGNDVPQYWAPYGTGTDAANLTNWTSTHRCKVIRAFGNYLVALNVTKSGTNSPHMVKWSHPATPGALPSSWDHTDPEFDAGENELSDVNSGLIVDGLPLDTAFFIYKENAIWTMRPINSTLIFAWDVFLATAGALCTRAVCSLFDGRHMFLSNDDIVLHNGKSLTPVGSKRFKRYIFNQIDPTNYEQTFLFDNPAYNECWICYPSNGNTSPNRALIYNYKTGVFTEADISFVAAALGTVQSSGASTWANAATQWNSWSGQWSNADSQSVIVANPAATKFYKLDSTEQRDGSDFTAYAMREHLAMAVSRTKQLGVDFRQRKQTNRVWLRLSGGPVEVRMGYSDSTKANSTIWTAYQSFDPTTQMWLDFTLSGRALGFEIRSTGNVSWRLEGYMLEIAARGGF